jgi:hypothetical protein
LSTKLRRRTALADAMEGSPKGKGSKTRSNANHNIRFSVRRQALFSPDIKIAGPSRQ